MSSRSGIYRAVVGPLAVATAVIGTAALAAAPAHAEPGGVIVTRNGSLLTITGGSVANALAVGANAAGSITLNGTAVLGGTATTSNILDIVIDGGDGNDTLLDQTPGDTLRVEFRGGEGNDQLLGGPKAETLVGGPGVDSLVGSGGDDILIGDAGNDKAIGGPGNDVVSLGADSDQFTWNPGDGNDHVDGDAGTDTLLFNGADRAPTDPFETEAFQFFSDGTRSKIIRVQLPAPNEPNDVMDFSGFEFVKASMAGGPKVWPFSTASPLLTSVSCGSTSAHPSTPRRTKVPSMACRVSKAPMARTRSGSAARRPPAPPSPGWGRPGSSPAHNPCSSWPISTRSVVPTTSSMPACWPRARLVSTARVAVEATTS
ncbi:MAG: hypothetical protein DLM58_19195 [Pseudonocardiales bacterium]|nr:MAG: hypothetical protein DLM58_19195 [Pseudonocardiales bacterium]